ncbi:MULTISPECIES: HAMP domain-containing sensor histidine kinase [unclassified Paenibacillus]|uniref:HAMP domain-containing sensor histidine kinase n=1 Tax=unclassified Paenibacillus TaxID=185978 RepID=UPI003633B25D
MKNVPLALKIWLVITAITLCLFAMLAFLLPWTLKGFFTEQIYDLLLDSQRTVPSEMKSVSITAARPVESIGAVNIVPKDLPNDQQVLQRTKTMASLRLDSIPAGPRTEASSVMHYAEPTNERMDELPSETASEPSMVMRVIRTAGQPFTMTLKPPAGPGIQHMVMLNGGLFSNTETTVPIPFAEAIEQDAELQLDAVQTYYRNIDDRTMFYVIRKEELQGQPGFMVSYAWGNYRNDLVMTMFQRLILLMMVLIVVSWIPCLWLSRYLSRPLVLMEQQVGRIAKRDWHEPFVLNRKDEMGRLALAFEAMRERLVRQDKSQQFFLQNISHELKTPVMVIHSYAQSILDGIYPKGTIANSVETIKSEATRLEKRIHDLLYLNKLNYLSARERKVFTFDLSVVIGDCVERLRYRQPELDWEVELPVLEVEGDAEQWGVAIENVLDNQLRYAKAKISITLNPSEEGANGSQDADQAAASGNAEIRLWNDGPPIEEALKASLFDQFQTGPDGQFGLGLAIAKQILEAHQAKIRVSNESEGAGFIIAPHFDKLENVGK